MYALLPVYDNAGSNDPFRTYPPLQNKIKNKIK